MNLIVDASVAAKWIIDEEGSGRARAFLGEPLAAPDTVLIEVFNAVHKRVRRREAAEDVLVGVLPFLQGAIGRTIPAGFLREKAARLALEYGHPIYGCLYVAAALQSDGALLTADGRLATVARRAGVGVDLLGPA